jgi:glycosyltransferase involved in cell wall biosynthesis
MKQLSIIIPVYNVEKYIRDCLLSIFRQGLSDDDFEVILVNDGSPDNSIEVLVYIISQHDNVIVVNQDNQGVSKARNAGFAIAKGVYIYYMDPDDMLVDNGLSVLLPMALSSSVDILMANYCRFNDGEDCSDLLHISQHYSDTKKTGEQAFLEDLSPYECYIWLMLIKRDFLFRNQIDFKPFWYEDTLFCQECFIKAKTIIKTNYKLYVYRLRPGSFTSSMNLNKMLDLNSCLSALVEIKKTVMMSKAVQNKLMDNIFASFSYGLWCVTHNKELYKERKTFVSDLKKKIPPSEFMFNGDGKQRIVSLFFRYLPYFYLKIRSLL